MATIVTLSDALETARFATILAGRTILFHGPPAIAKTEGITQLALDTGMNLSLWLPYSNPTDMYGIPFVNVSEQTMEWSIPAEIKRIREFDSRGIATMLFVDEITRGTSMVQNVLMSVIHDKRAGEHRLPDSCRIIAACNDDGPGITRLSPAMTSRFATHLYIGPDADSFLNHAAANGFHHSVIGYIRNQTEAGNTAALYDYEQASIAPGWPNYRSWKSVSDMLNAGLPERLEGAAFEGAIGQRETRAFVGYLMLARNAISIDDILANPATARIPDDTGLLFAASRMLIRSAEQANMTEVMTYLNRLPDEYSIYAVRTLAELEKNGKKTGVTSNPAFAQWAIKHQAITTW